MPTFHLIPAQNITAWMEVLERCGEFDTYHLPEYHLLANEQKEGDPVLFYFESGEHCAALPFLIREVSTVPGLESYTYHDATSVYGYPGIVSSVNKNDIAASVYKEEFQKALHAVFEELGIVTFFSRLNPLIPGSWLFEPMGDVVTLSSTVAINLRQPESEIRKGITKGHLYDIRKARKQNIRVSEDKDIAYLDDFIRMYNETMKHRDAAAYYYFPKSYYIRCKELFPDAIKLYIAEKNGELLSASFFLLTNNIIQYHLSGTPRKYLKYAGAKLIIDEVRRWGMDHGFTWLHLGGGVGSKENPLFRFKAGFSKLRLPFEVVRLVAKPDIYARLIEKRSEWVRINGGKEQADVFFPLYRRPLVKETG